MNHRHNMQPESGDLNAAFTPNPFGLTRRTWTMDGRSIIVVYEHPRKFVVR